MKFQVLADFLVEYMWSNDELEETLIEQPPKSSDLGSTWILHIDAASNLQGSRTGLILTNSEGVVIKYALYFLFKATNN